MTGVMERIAAGAAGLVARRTSRRGFLAGTAVVGSALAVAPRTFVLRPVSAYDAVCGSGASCSEGWTVFCCTVNNGVNACPPGTFVGGWWKIDSSSFCGGGARYIIDCQGECTSCSNGCGGNNSFCDPGCVNCGCDCGPASTCDQRRHCCNYFRYGQCHQEIACGGPVACRMVTCVPPWQLDPSCTASPATDNRTADHSAPCLGPDSIVIQQKYMALGGPAGFLGAPVSTELLSSDGVGHYQRYANGSIYWAPATGAWFVRGAILAEWGVQRAEVGVLGYPLMDEATTPDGVGAYQHFAGGSVYWSPATGAHAVWGPIRDAWSALGWEAGPLGYPVWDVHPCDDGIGQYAHFQRGARPDGSIYWSPTTGAHGLWSALRDAWLEGGAEKGPFGYPVSGMLPAPDGGYLVRFQNGNLRQTPDGAVDPTWDRIRRRRPVP